MPECPSDNTLEVDQSTFWGPDGVNWDAHRIGWAISGGCALLASLGFLVLSSSSLCVQTSVVLLGVREHVGWSHGPLLCPVCPIADDGVIMIPSSPLQLSNSRLASQTDPPLLFTSDERKNANLPTLHLGRRGSSRRTPSYLMRGTFNSIPSLLCRR